MCRCSPFFPCGWFSRTTQARQQLAGSVLYCFVTDEIGMFPCFSTSGHRREIHYISWCDKMAEAITAPVQTAISNVLKKRRTALTMDRLQAALPKFDEKSLLNATFAMRRKGLITFDKTGKGRGKYRWEA